MRTVYIALCLAIFAGVASSAERRVRSGSGVFSTSVNYRYVKMNKRSVSYRYHDPFPPPWYEQAGGWDRRHANGTESSSVAGAVSYAYHASNWRVGVSGQYEYSDRRRAYDFESIGFALHYGDSKYQYNSKDRNDSFGATLFGSADLPYGMYIEGLFHFSANSQKTKSFGWTSDDPGHTVAFLEEGKTSHNTVAAGLRAGKEFIIGDDWLISPFIGFDYAHKQAETFSFDYIEDLGGWKIPGSARIIVPSHEFFEIPIGVKLAKDFHVGSGWIITPSLEASLVNSIGEMDVSSDKNTYDNGQSYPGFSVYNGSEWRTYGMAGGHLGGRIKARLAARMNDRLDFAVSYSFEGRNRLQEHKVSASFGLSF